MTLFGLCFILLDTILLLCFLRTDNPIENAESGSKHDRVGDWKT